MEALIRKSEITPKNNFKSKAQTKSSKIVLGTGRNMAEIDYNAVFDNEIKK